MLRSASDGGGHFALRLQGFSRTALLAMDSKKKSMKEAELELVLSTYGVGHVYETFFVEYLRRVRPGYVHPTSTLYVAGSRSEY